jgi:glucose/arabinose dehydrogenase
MSVPDLPSGTRLEKLMDGFDVLWGLEPLSENEVLLTQKNGKMFFVDFGKKKRFEISGIPQVSTSGQAGLLDVRLSPNFSKEKLIYLTYSKKTDQGDTTALIRAKLDTNKYNISATEELFVGKTDNSGGVHFGSRIAFDSVGHLYFGIGDRGERERAQELNWHNGKIIRLKLDGRIPGDNPFVGQRNARPEIFSFGHRNPQGLYYSKKLDKLFNSEHGPRGGDEINEIRKGLNYGWPVVTYGREYYGPKIGEGQTKAGMEQPLKVYIPSIAPSSLIVYESGIIKAFTNSFLLGALALQHLNVVSLDGKTERRFLQSMAKRFRQVKEGLDGSVFLTTDSGEIFRLFSNADHKPLSVRK